MIITVMWYKGKKLFITLSPSKLGREREFKITCYQKEVGKSRKRIGKLEYTLKESRNGIANEIHIDGMNVEKAYRMKGYGRILMGFAQGIAQASKLEITLFSFGDVVGFYKKCGFHPECQDSQDMIWSSK